MKVLVTAITQPSGMSGVQRHALNLVRCLLALPQVQVVHLLLAPWQLHLHSLVGLQAGDRLRIEVAQVDRGAAARNLWHLRQLPRLARSLGVDLVHLSFPMPFLRATMPCPVVVTLHDLYPFTIPSNFGFPQVLVNRWVLRCALGQAHAIAAVSRATGHQLALCRLGGSALHTVIPNCVEPAQACSARGPVPHWNGELFLLSVAQHRRNKNLALLLRSFAYLLSCAMLPRSSRLVIVGIEGPETARLIQLVEELEISARVHFLHGLSEAELHWCYRHCAAVVAPSLTEGFGLPIAEARLAGCRVVCSDIAPFRELAGPHVHFVSLERDGERAFSAAIVNALAQPRPEPEPLPALSVPTVAQAYLTLYQAVLTGHGAAAPSSRSPNRPWKQRHTL